MGKDGMLSLRYEGLTSHAARNDNYTAAKAPLCSSHAPSESTAASEVVLMSTGLVYLQKKRAAQSGAALYAMRTSIVTSVLVYCTGFRKSLEGV
jgi:hypothetical protein